MADQQHSDPSGGSRRAPHHFSSIFVVLTILTTGVLVIAILVASPLIVVLIAARTPGMDWGRLSSVGETYGAVSAVLSGLAVGGVAVSLLLQARQLRIGQFQGMRLMHLELMRLLLQDPTLVGISPVAIDIPREQWRREI